MRKCLFTLCILAYFPLVAAEDDWILNNAFAVWGDVAFIRRAEGHQQHLFFDMGQGSPNSCGSCHHNACNSRALFSRFHYEPGYRVGMAYLTRHTYLEATYLWIADWRSSCHRANPGLINFSESNTNLFQDYSGADAASAHYLSQFRNAEINYFFYVTPRRGDVFSVAWLVGVRYMDFSENLELAFENAAAQSTYDIYAKNRIPALQAGGSIGWNPTRTISWDLIAKLGMGFDWCSQHTFLGDANNTLTLRNYDKSCFATPLVAAGGLSLTYQPWKFFNVHASYELIYLNGVATAPVQIDKSPHAPHRIKSDGYALFHGWLAGLTFSF